MLHALHRQSKKVVSLLDPLPTLYMVCIITHLLTPVTRERLNNTNQFAELYLLVAQLCVHVFALWCRLQCRDDLHLDIAALYDIKLQHGAQHLQRKATHRLHTFIAHGYIHLHTPNSITTAFTAQLVVLIM